MPLRMSRDIRLQYVGDSVQAPRIVWDFDALMAAVRKGSGVTEFLTNLTDHFSIDDGGEKLEK